MKKDNDQQFSLENVGNLSSLGKVYSIDKQSNQSQIGHSGNSDVDVNVDIQVDTMPIAFAILCSLLATKQMTNEEFDLAVAKLETLTNRYKKSNDRRETNDRSKANGINPKRWGW
ncbi:hypothetical protein [Thermolongibacillus altinsuensis]|uniref:hypothetical protein n=1 Tax=Thermolongibacillus altinsuensis TaxID=575256 RepID=UPI00242A323B|nr:hypothetical protein [Thermolongibacillus altinsuensis]GMB10093.1 hypothetical protein B1no1_28030 [Thermolongibacillus altinsuensis]